jgi:hypothetical protein
VTSPSTARPALHPTPRLRDVVREQLGAVALALRAPSLAILALAGVATALVVAEHLTGGGPVDFAPELSMVPGMLGALLPIGVWQGEERFGASFFWTLPVDRRRHALARVGAGWAWLMVVVALVVLWFLVLAFLTGGNILGEQTVRVLPSTVVPLPGTLDPGALRLVRWAPPPLYWVVPFTGATGAYLLASALALGARYPFRWLVGGFLALLLLGATGEAAGITALRFAPSRIVEALFEGRYGLDALLTARTESLHTVATLSTGRTVGVWRALPRPGDWAVATLLWVSCGALALWGAAYRHRERRRG